MTPWYIIVENVFTEIAQAANLSDLDPALASLPPEGVDADIALPCFTLAKELQKSPADIAKDLADKLSEHSSELIASVTAAGPYLNIALTNQAIAQNVTTPNTFTFGSHTFGDNQKIVIEYACPNPMKAFHLGHLKNLITGEAVVRTFENAGYDVVRVNYQGDVGMHIAKSLWGIYANKDAFDDLDTKPLKERVEFLGQAYAAGAQHFEKGDTEKQEVLAYNEKVYTNDPSIQDVYTKARTWSLEYFDTIYQDLGTCFDQLYFESEVFARGKELVEQGLEKGIFKKSDGAVIYEAEKKHNLHDRVFLNSRGFPTYEAKDLGLAEKHFADHNPDQVIHVVGKEQTGYFQVVFKALEEVLPQTTDKEYHLIGGYLQLKGDTKMSSRLGNVITGDALIKEVQDRVRAIMQENDQHIDEETLTKVSTAALKYAMLKSDVSQDVAFDMETSVSTAGDSGPYLLYIVARINSILNKANDLDTKNVQIPKSLAPSEKSLILKLTRYPDATKQAVESYDPSYIARYLFELAQAFNHFYHECPVLKAEEGEQAFRLALIRRVRETMIHGLDLLGIESVESM